MAHLTTPDGHTIRGFTHDRPRPSTQHTVDIVLREFPGQAKFTSYDSSSEREGDHGDGSGLDTWFGGDSNAERVRVGTDIVKWLVRTHGERLRYINWQQQMWYPEWRGLGTAPQPYASRGNPTDNHRDHAHIATLRAASTSFPSLQPQQHAALALAIPTEPSRPSPSDRARAAALARFRLYYVAGSRKQYSLVEWFQEHLVAVDGMADDERDAERGRYSWRTLNGVKRFTKGGSSSGLVGPYYLARLQNTARERRR